MSIATGTEQARFNYVEFLGLCCLDMGRFTTSTPVLGKDGLVYATDGRIIVRVESGLCKTTEEATELHIKSFGEVFKDFPEVREMRPIDIPAFEDKNIQPCGVCNGVNRGEFPETNDVGDCERCNGVGRILVESSDTIDGAKFSAAYSQLIRRLPKLHVKAGIRTGRTHRGAILDDLPVLFVSFEGGTGVLAGLRNK